MNEQTTDRRSVIKGLALTGAAVVAGSSLPSQAQAMFDKSIEIGALAKLAKNYDSIPFELADKTKALLVCTHNGCMPAAPNAEGILACPCHGAKFNADGTVNKGPAKKPLAGIKIAVKAGKVMATGMLMG
jgi:Rieske Fe-S protein